MGSLRDEYLATLYRLVDRLLTTQIRDPGSADYGALVSPNTNPDLHPIYSRAGEAVYPFAVAFKHSGNVVYRDGALLLGDWLARIQPLEGGWNEDWPAEAGWLATTADQVLSLAGALQLLNSQVSADRRERWASAIARGADWIETNLPVGNVNYSPTGAVALVCAYRAVEQRRASWLDKARSLMELTLASITPDSFLTGEAGGVDPGYNLAQAIGFVAMYGRLCASELHVEAAARLLRAHLSLVYPNGAIDNSWGTRSFKWIFESGTKTAPGVHFTFALLADRDPRFARAAELALAFLRDRCIDEDGWVGHGPHASQHGSTHPPSSYATFARAQSIAMALELGPETIAPSVAPIPAEQKNWFEHFASFKTCVLRTDAIMATVSAYPANFEHPRESVVRGGSVSALWFEGYGPTGFMQVSSQTRYARIEPKHMPSEAELASLTPRIETRSGPYATNVFDDRTELEVQLSSDAIVVVSSGTLRAADGRASGTRFVWTHRFGPDWYAKKVELFGASCVRIVEPFVDNRGNRYELNDDRSVVIVTADGGVWELEVRSATSAYRIVAGEDRSKYWNPFPGIECYPVIIELSDDGDQSIEYVVRRATAS